MSRTFFKNAHLYRAQEDIAISSEALEEQLGRLAFAMPESGRERRGWIPAGVGNTCVREVGLHWLIRMRTARRLLPAAVVRQRVKEVAALIEHRQGYKPGRRQLKDIKDRVLEELLPKAFLQMRDTDVWIDRANGWVVVDTASSKRADEVLSLLSKTVDPFAVEPLQVQTAPGRVMTQWVLEGEASEGFSIDQDAELRSRGRGHGAIRWVRHSIETVDARRHIEQGKQCTRLALTWADKISFTLTEDLTLRRLRFLDVLQKDLPGDVRDEAETFDTSFALMAGELAGLLAALMDCLGGCDIED
ncbi:recombination-associated protein RdgC [Achromobacter xylosoxidans]